MKKKIYQSCHILHKRGKFRILHFKELFALDKKPYNMSQEDINRRNVIAKLLENWGLVDLLSSIPNIPIDGTKLRVLSFKEKTEFELIPKYQIRKKRG
jgi:hypothetical protein